MFIVNFGYLVDFFFTPNSQSSVSNDVTFPVFFMVILGLLICSLLGVIFYLLKNQTNYSLKQKPEKNKQFLEDSILNRCDFLKTIALNMGIWNWMDVGQDAQEWSPCFYSSLGYKDKEISATKENFLNLIHPDDRKEMEDALEEHLECNKPFNQSCRLRKASNEYIWFSCSGQAIRNGKGEPIRMMGSIKNIHDQINAIKALKQSNDDLDQFAYATSHDLREPLRNIRNFSNFLMEDYEDKLDEEGKENLRTIQKLCMHLDTYLQDLFRFSRLSADQASCVNIDIKNILEDVKSMVLNCSEENIVINVPSKLPNFCCDPAKMSIIFSNLFKNSIRYNQSKKKVVSVKYKDIGNGQHQFWVEDNGIGIKQEHWKDIFIIFRRLHNRKDYEEGSGIGLSLIKKAVEKHNGSIWVEESTPGKGTVISFILRSLEESQNLIFEDFDDEKLKIA